MCAPSQNEKNCKENLKCIKDYPFAAASNGTCHNLRRGFLVLLKIAVSTAVFAVSVGTW